MPISEWPLRTKLQHRPERLELADQRPIGRSKPVVPLETAEFNQANLAGDREGAMSTAKQPIASVGLRGTRLDR